MIFEKLLFYYSMIMAGYAVKVADLALACQLQEQFDREFTEPSSGEEDSDYHLALVLHKRFYVEIAATLPSVTVESESNSSFIEADSVQNYGI